jgi:UDP-glucose 4-epimerase
MYGMVVPRFVSAALKNETLQVHGDGTQSRVFCHVDDVLDVLMQLIQNDRTIGEVYNIGGQGEISILNLAKEVISQTGSKSKIELLPYEKVYDSTFEDMQRRIPDITKISQLLEWKPKRNLEAIINSIAAQV